jgi:hypothetical protein
VIAPWALKESITRVDKLATLIIVAGVVLSTAFGSHNSVAWSMSGLPGRPPASRSGAAPRPAWPRGTRRQGRAVRARRRYIYRERCERLRLGFRGVSLKTVRRNRVNRADSPRRRGGAELLELFKEPLFIIVTAGLWCLGDHRLERFSAA